jgi:hypothetical protein
MAQRPYTAHQEALTAASTEVDGLDNNEFEDIYEEEEEPTAQVNDFDNMPLSYRQYIWDTSDVGTGEAVDVLAMRMGKKDRDYIICFHCGVSGHYAGDCSRNDGKTPQSFAGKQAYLKFQRETGVDKTYDPVAVKEKAEERRRLRGESESNNNRFRESARQTAFRSIPATNASTNKPTTYNNNNRRPQPSSSSNKANTNNNKFRSSRPASSSSSLSSSSSSSSSRPTNNNHPIAINSTATATVGNDYYVDGYDRLPPAADDSDVIDINSVNVIGDVCTISSSNDEHAEIARQAAVEKMAASSLCMNLAMNNIELKCPSMVDSGCTSTVIRKKAFDDSGLAATVTVQSLEGQVVRGSTGELLKVPGRYNTKMTNKGNKFADAACVYIVEKCGDADLICDVIIGRSTLAVSEYPLLHNGEGRLYSDDKSKFIQCDEACSAKDENGSSIIRAKPMSERRQVCSSKQ